MRFRLIGFDEGGVRQSQGNATLRLVCQIEGDGKLAIWGSVGARQNIDRVLNAGMPCEIECDCIPPEEWATKYGHSF
jgi:hypothetical protein